MHSNPVSVFVIGTIGDTTTQSLLISGKIWEQIESHINTPAKLYKIKLRETPTIFTEYYGPKK